MTPPQPLYSWRRQKQKATSHLVLFVQNAGHVEPQQRSDKSDEWLLWASFVGLQKCSGVRQCGELYHRIHRKITEFRALVVSLYMS